MDFASIPDIIERLAQGKPLDGLPVARHNGRIDLRNVDLFSIEHNRNLCTVIPPQAQASLGRFAGLVELRVVPLSLENIELRDIDFSGSRLDRIRFLNCTIKNCMFDNASCEGWGMWATSVSDSSFTSASLRGAALAGLHDNEQDRFENVSFTKTDLRGTAHGWSEYVGCTFDNANLLKVDFNGSRFVRCVFRGELCEIEFYDHAFRGENFPPNTMEDVDFSGASLHDVDFRRLNLDRVKFPVDDEHLVLSNYTAALDYAITQLRDDDDDLSRKIRLYLEFCRKWVGPKQMVGVFNRLDIVEWIGEDGRARLEGLLRGASSSHAVLDQCPGPASLDNRARGEENNAE